LTARARDTRGDTAAERRLRAEMRRLEGEHLVVPGEGRFDFRKRSACTRGDDQFRGIVSDDAAVSARIEDLTLQRLAVPVFRAVAANPHWASFGGGRTDSFGPFGDDVVLFHGVVFRCSGFDCTGRRLAGNPERTRTGSPEARYCRRYAESVGT